MYDETDSNCNDLPASAFRTREREAEPWHSLAWGGVWARLHFEPSRMNSVRGKIYIRDSCIKSLDVNLILFISYGNDARSKG